MYVDVKPEYKELWAKAWAHTLGLPYAVQHSDCDAKNNSANKKDEPNLFEELRKVADYRFERTSHEKI